MTDQATYSLRSAQYHLLVEAARRWVCFDQRDGYYITNAWTGLGTWAVYRPVVNDGLMECVHALHKRPRHPQWWKLTESGAAIVQHWLSQGLIAIQDYRVTQLPPAKGVLLNRKQEDPTE